MDVIGIAGPRIRLVPLDKERHLENYLRWLNDPEVTRYLTLNWPLTRLAEERWFERAAEDETHLVWAIHDENGRHIGSTGLHRINWRERLAASGIVIGEKDAWGQGYGTEVMQVRTKFAFEQIGLHRIESECFAENQASAHCLEKAGYRREGLARKKFWRQGRWHDAILWAILDEDYFGLT
jgi:RimJ/RimL family protein N-acetyltransferase